MEDQQVLLARYTALMQLWMHHNTAQLQWPPVIIGLVLVGLASLLSSQMNSIVQVDLWGTSRPIEATGICFLIAGLGILVMRHTMGRARLIMARTEAEIRLVEQMLGIKTPQTEFTELNHPSGQVSGPLLIGWYLVLGLAAPVWMLGFLFLFGVPWGGIPAAFAVVCLIVEASRVGLDHQRLIKTYRRQT